MTGTNRGSFWGCRRKITQQSEVRLAPTLMGWGAGAEERTEDDGIRGEKRYKNVLLELQYIEVETNRAYYKW